MSKFLRFCVVLLVALVGFAADPAALFERGELSVSTASACSAAQPNCRQPTAVKKGTKVPVWEVQYCVIGPAGGPYHRLSCRDPRAVHESPLGLPSKCFFGTDGKVHWGSPQYVFEGRRFINQFHNGRWMINWQD